MAMSPWPLSDHDKACPKDEGGRELTLRELTFPHPSGQPAHHPAPACQAPFALVPLHPQSQLKRWYVVSEIRS